MISNLVSATWLNTNLNNPNLVILDASQTSNKANLTAVFETVQIPHSRPFDLKVFSDSKSELPNTFPSTDQFEREARKLGINDTSIIIVYDNLGIYTSPRVWWLFKTMGHQNVAALNGGLPGWIKNNFETEKKQAHSLFNSGNFSAQLNTNVVRYFNDIKNNLETQEELIIDARSHDRFHALVPEPRKGLRGGHIPMSINIPFQNVLENGSLKSNAVLTKLFSAFNLRNKPLVFSCGSGLTACIVYLACEQVLDNKKAIYDGSWTEWAQRT